jgi:hypothetical protein
MPSANRLPARDSSRDLRSARDCRTARSHSRAVSPTVSNYFGLAREPPISPANIFARVRKNSSGETGGLGFWRGRSLSYTYPFFGASSDHSDNSEAEEDVEDGPSNDLVDDGDDEEDDEIDTFEILGHR